MNAERWQRIKLILEEAMEIAPVTRATYLKKVCAGDETLRREVESLLDGDGTTGADALFEQDAFSVVMRNDVAGRAKNSGGERIGNYKITGELGAGGMGAVFLAERGDGEFEQQVALKIVKKGMDSEAILRRFQIERQILANLNHPHIARLFDGGTTKDGLPFFAMEYVKGEPLDEFCDWHQLSVSARLELFCRVCAAVEYAHRNQVIHRDLKPSNILVTANGTPKLLDFGIAKILRAENSLETAEITETVFRAMTPRYASPEQIRGERLAAGTDVYSLGVILYELLTGRSPYKFTNRRPEEIARAVGETEFERPSAAVTRPVEEAAPTDGDDAGKKSPVTREQICLARGDADADALRRRLRGDLDRIVLTALAKEPAERYQSVEEFSADIGQHLGGLPLLHARKKTMRRRGTAFVERRFVRGLRVNLPVLALALVIAATTFGFSVYWLRGLDGTAAANLNVKSIAVLPFKYVSEAKSDDNLLLGVGLADYLINKLGQTKQLEVRPISAVQTYASGDFAPRPIGQNLNVDAVLSGTLRRTGETISINAELVHVADGRTIWNRQMSGRAENLVELQNAFSEELTKALTLPPADAEQRTLAKQRTANARAYEFYVRGRYFWNRRTQADHKKAIEHFNQAIALDPNYADAYAGLADATAQLDCELGQPAACRAAQMQSAKEYALRALSLDETMAQPHTTLGYIAYHFEWDWAAAERHFKRALELNPSYATAHQWQANMLVRLGRFDEAVHAMERARQLEPLSPIMYQDSVEILYYARRYDEALEVARQARELTPTSEGEYPHVSAIYYHKGDYQKHIELEEEKADRAGRSVAALKSLARTYLSTNREKEWRRITGEIRNLGGKPDFENFKTFAEKKKASERAYKAGGRKFIEDDFNVRGAGITLVNVHPDWEWMLDDPKIQDMIRRTGLVPRRTGNGE